MRKWRAKKMNRERTNASRRKADAHKRSTNPEWVEKQRERKKKYEEENKEVIRARAKANNWYYNPEKSKIKRAKYQETHSTEISIASARKRAEKKGLSFDLTVEWYNEQFAKGCAMTGLPLDPNGFKTPWVAHVDRINPEDGYTIENCRLVVACYNLAKKHWTDKDVLRMANALVNNSVF